MSEILQIKSRWQLTLPPSAREALSVKEGDYLSLEVKDAMVLLKPLRTVKLVAKPQPASHLKSIAGKLSIGGHAVRDARKLYR